MPEPKLYKQKILDLTFYDQQAANRFIVALIKEEIKKKPKTNFLFPTGKSPLGIYQELSNWSQKAAFDWKEINIFNLDEYFGIAKDNPQSYHYFMHKELFGKINFPLTNSHFPSLETNFDALIEAKGGLDFALLGIGLNGHIGFNEPGSKKDSLTRRVSLSQSTLKANAPYFKEQKMPTEALSAGLKTIFSARKIVLVAFGPAKTEVLKKLRAAQKFDPQFPASILKEHPHLVIVSDSCE